MSIVAARPSRPGGEGATDAVGPGTGSLRERSARIAAAVNRRVPISIVMILVPASVGIARVLASINVSEPDPTQFGLAASVVVELQKAGVRLHLEPDLSTHYGPQEQVQRSGAPDRALLVISGPHDPAPAGSTAGASHLGTVEGMDLWLRPLAPT